MGLRASQRRALKVMEQRLYAREPKLVAMYSIFTMLANGEPLPSTETISRRLWRSSSRRNARLGHIMMAAATPLLLTGLVAAVLLVAGLGPSAGRCAPYGMRYSASNTGFRPGTCAQRLQLRYWRSPVPFGK